MSGDRRRVGRAWLLLGILAGLALPVAAAGPGAHQHGVARLDVAIDGSTLLIALDSPLVNLLGFEHAPRNQRERGELGKMAAALRTGEAFRPNPEAACRLTGVDFDPPFAGQPPSGPRDAAGSRADSAGDSHRDAEVAWTFECSASPALRWLDVDLFARFPGLTSLKVQVAGPRGQSAGTLTRRQTRLRW